MPRDRHQASRSPEMPIRLPAGSRFTYGPLAYLLKNRTYLGEIGHEGERFAGEHGAIIDQATFDQVQNLMKANSVTRRQKRSNDDALLPDCSSTTVAIE